MKARAGRGFTLLELLVALAIFAVLAVLAYGGLSTVLHARDRTDQAAKRLGELQSAMLLLSRDLRQAAPRPIRDEFGDARAALLGVSEGEPRLELTRAGNANPANLQRSTLERVGYALDGGTLYRLYWAVLDRSPDSQPQKVSLLTRVDELSLRYQDAQGQWHDSWPPLTANGGPPPALPVAVEVGLQLADWGRITRLFGLPRETETTTRAPQQTPQG